MTAFARVETEGIAWEIRSVNQRYLDVNFKIPESVRFTEPGLREALRNKLQRGKLDCMLRINLDQTTTRDIKINVEMLNNLKAASEVVTQTIPNLRAPTALEVLQWPGVLGEDQLDQEVVGEKVMAAFTEALQQLTAMRAREGAELERMIRERLTALSDIVTSVRQEVSLIQARQQEKIRARITELDVSVDESRLEQELVYQAQKSDVAEELDRLETHVEEVKKTLASTKPVGRRLDFLMQELNREANTLSSKAIAADTTIAAVELKVIIEQMREQVQNIE
jgi:uncharacterized protein (TIGR00255 family)